MFRPRSARIAASSGRTRFDERSRNYVTVDCCRTVGARKQLLSFHTRCMHSMHVSFIVCHVLDLLFRSIYGFIRLRLLSSQMTRNRVNRSCDRSLSMLAFFRDQFQREDESIAAPLRGNHAFPRLPLHEKNGRLPTDERPPHSRTSAEYEQSQSSSARVYKELLSPR